jgi:hypothetical protein
MTRMMTAQRWACEIRQLTAGMGATMRTAIFCIFLSVIAYAKDQYLTLDCTKTQTEIMAAVGNSFVQGNFQILDSGPHYLLMERPVDATFRGYERVRVDSTETDGRTRLTVHAWTGARSSITIGAKHSINASNMQTRYGDRFALLKCEIAN